MPSLNEQVLLHQGQHGQRDSLFLQTGSPDAVLSSFPLPISGPHHGCWVPLTWDLGQPISVLIPICFLFPDTALPVSMLSCPFPVWNLSCQFTKHYPYRQILYRVWDQLHFNRFICDPLIWPSHTQCLSHLWYFGTYLGPNFHLILPPAVQTTQLYSKFTIWPPLLCSNCWKRTAQRRKKLCLCFEPLLQYWLTEVSVELPLGGTTP